MKLKCVYTKTFKYSVTAISLLILGVYSSIAQETAKPVTPAAVEKTEATIANPTMVTAPATAPIQKTVDSTKPVVSKVKTPNKQEAKPVEAPAVKSTIPEVKPAATPTTNTKTTVKPVETMIPAVKTEPKPIVKPVPMEKSTPTITSPAPVKTKKLPSTVTSTAPGYSSSSSSSWDGVTSEYQKMHELLGDRIHIGLRSMSFSLDETSRVGQNNNYLGTIDELSEVQNTSLANVTLGFYPIRNLGIEYRRDEVRAKTFTDTDDNHSDGDFVVDGPIFLAIARLPLDQLVTLFNKASGNESIDHNTAAHRFARRFIPYIGIGATGLSGEFEADTWWANGYASPASWEELGSPEGVIRNGHTREIKVTDEKVGTYFVYGISLRVIDNFYADFSFSQVSVDLTTDFSLDGNYQYSSTIPMSYTSTSIGIRYYF